MKNFVASLWYETGADEAPKFYTGIFKNSKMGKSSHYTDSSAKVSGMKKGALLTQDFRIENMDVSALNGGPHAKFNPSLSFYVSCETEQEIKDLWGKLSAGGQVRMGLDKYPWSQMYGWTADKFGVDWQLNLVPNQSEKIAMSFLFVDKLYGKGDEAVKFYTTVFPNSKLETIQYNDKDKTVMHASFKLNGQTFKLMEGEGKHGHVFNDAFSVTVQCDNQDEIDQIWKKLTANGGKEVQCGWCTDKFGVSWQVVPTELQALMTDDKTNEKVFAEMLKMKKLDLAKLKAAAKS